MLHCKGVLILGATGTIGVNTLDVIDRHRESYHIVALTAYKNYQKLYQQCITYQPRFAVVVDEVAADHLRNLLQKAGSDTEVLQGEKPLEWVASHVAVDYVMAAIVGAAGLLPSLAAARAGKRILLANKEALVMSGHLFIEAVKQSGAELLPIDSEHNAIFQCIGGASYQGIEKILLTGSGGPFRQRDIDTLEHVKVEEAIAHPNWNMGKKISVDSATMMNKGLEVIEACWLFDLRIEDIQVVIHPQSTIHSMVAYKDGSVLAQLGQPDMRTPIAYGLGWPERIDAGVAALNFFDIQSLTFDRPDFKRFPCLEMAYSAYEQGGFACIALNAANEVAVDAFLSGIIRFTDIAKVIDFSLQNVSSGTPSVLNEILIQDSESRRIAQSWITHQIS